MTPIFLDIEVLQQNPEPFMVPALEELEPPANYKKAETIAEWRAEKATTQLRELREKSSLEPLLGGTVWCVGLASGVRVPTILHAPTNDEEGERTMLARVEVLLAKVDHPVLVTWNGGYYDLPFLAKRALRHGLYTLSGLCHQAKPWGKHHLDLFQVWQQHNRSANGKLVQVAAYLGADVPTDYVPGSEVTTLIEGGYADRVVEHCRADVAMLRQIYWRMRAAGWVSVDDMIPDDLPVRPPRQREVVEGQDEAEPVSGVS